MLKKVVILFPIFVANILFSCGQPSKYFTHHGYTQGTIYKITYESPTGVSFDAEIKRLLIHFSNSLSTYIPNSLISRVNQNDPTVRADRYFKTVFQKSVEINQASGGAFDITIAPIVNFWGFGFTSDKPDTDQRKIDSLLQFVGMNKVRMEGDRIIKDDPGVMLDVNAIAKGYSVDVVGDFLAKKGCKNYMVDIGGEVLAKGYNASGRLWTIWVDRPADNALPGEACQALIQVQNKALATSGNYRRFFEIDGVKYAHSINVKTGYPAKTNLLSVTIIAFDCMTADAWATACMVSGLEKSIELIQANPELDALLIYSDEQGNYQVYITESLQKYTINCE